MRGPMLAAATAVRESSATAADLVMMVTSDALQRLVAAGFTEFWKVVDGFEGDANPATAARDRKGRRNAGLPWTYDVALDIAGGVRRLRGGPAAAKRRGPSTVVNAGRGVR